MFDKILKEIEEAFTSGVKEVKSKVAELEARIEHLEGKLAANSTQTATTPLESPYI